MFEANSLTSKINFECSKKHNRKLVGAKAMCLAASFMLVMGPANVAMAASDANLNFKIYSPQDPPAASSKSESSETTPDTSAGSSAAQPDASASEGPKSIFEEAMPTLDTTPDKPAGALPADAGPETEAKSTTTTTETPAAAAATPAAADDATTPATSSAASTEAASAPADATTTEAKSDAPKSDKVLQGYIRVVPTGTKIPIVMDTAVDSDTSQESDEFSARTSEDLCIDGSTVVPAGSVIKGRIAQLNAPKAMSRSGSVALKFDTITTPDNRQIPLVANIVAHGGVVHARRGMKDVAIDVGAVSLPMLAGLAIGFLAGNNNNNNNNSTTNNNNNSKHVSKATGAMIGVGIGLAVGVIILCAKKGKKVEVRPGDELKIELAEDLRMPTM
ncbi:MAG: hypothetical protein JSS83_25535 [Cyanobacteria bacterium SZAS LIN-3]|nr:hypothetical protein [Cyanobacteria bacterium SZAS LIN-3]